MTFRFLSRFLAATALFFAFASTVFAQGSSGTVSGTVVDPTGAVIPGSTIVISNAVSGYTRTATADAAGQFRFYNLPMNPYRVTASSPGFADHAVTVQVSSTFPLTIKVSLAVSSAANVIEVDAAPDLIETDPHGHTDIDRTSIDHLPIESTSSALSSIVTELSPGVAADSNGLLHGLGDHNEVSFSFDGQPITDQQSKVFSNQPPAASIQSLEVIEGAPPAEYGDKTSIVIVATTRSGQGVTQPTGSIVATYGSFGTSTLAFDMAYGGKAWGNFIAVDGQQSGRFLDAPEFIVYHDKGNEANLFDRFDRQLSDVSSLHTNFQYTRSWFQTPNSYDTQYGFVQAGTTTGKTDQRSKISTIDIAPTYTRIIGDTSVFNFAPFVRSDSYHYYPSNNPLNDLGPIQQEAVAQQRSLTNLGVHSDISYVKGRNNVKLGAFYAQTFLRENDQVGLVDPSLNDPAGATFNPILTPYDLTRGGHLYAYHGQTDVKQIAFYGQDQITAGNFIFNLGARGDIYNGLSIQRVGEPRIGISYKIPQSNTVLRLSYARTQETPFNENLVLSSRGCVNPVLQAIFETIGNCQPAPFNPGFRNEFHAGFQQGIGKHFVLDAEYITKYTHNAYDFSVFGATPITFPIEVHNSKIPGYTLSGTLTRYKGLTARVTASSVAARFFPPQIGGVGATVGATAGTGSPYRIDHDEKFNQTTHLEYAMPFRKSLYASFNWKFDSGLVAASTPCYNATGPNTVCANFSFDANGNPLTLNGKPAINLSSLTPDEQFQAGLACDGVRATQTRGLTICDAAGLSSSLVKIPAPGTSDDDHNPARIASRNLFDMALGDDSLVKWGSKDRYHLGARVTAINLTNKYALYNFLSTFSGTHYVTPRSVTAELALHF